MPGTVTAVPPIALTNGSAHFQNGQPCDGTEVYQNFSDLLSGLNNHDHYDIDGWTSTSDTWTRTGTTTFTVPGNQTTKYKKGTLIKCTDGGSNTVYGVIGSSAYTSLTTVTLISNTDYSLAAGTITNNKYTYGAHAQGFPPYFNYTSGLAGSGSMTVTSASFNFARWYTIGGVLFMFVSCSFTIGGTPSYAVLVNLPVNNVSGTGGTAIVNPDGTGRASAVGGGASQISVYALNDNTASAWTAGAGRTLEASFTYAF